MSRPYPDKRDAVRHLWEIIREYDAVRPASPRLRFAIRSARVWLRQRGYTRPTDGAPEGASRIRGNRADFIIFDDPAAAPGSGVGDEWFTTLKPL